MELEFEGMLGQNLNSKFLLQNIPRLNPKFFCSAFVVKAYAVLIAIRPSDGDVKLGGPLSDFR